MTSLAEAYQHNAREVSSPRRLYAGTALVLAGVGLAVLALLVGTTDVLVAETFASRELAGILGGLAVPAVLIGVFTVLPTNRRVRAAAVIAASICLLGVALFSYAYPNHWDGYGNDLTLFVSGVYLVGLISAVWCLFVAIANFKTRNDPGGALQMNVTRRGRTKLVEVDRSTGLGGVGLLGATPDGEVETQTNRPDQGSPSGSTTGSASNSPPANTGSGSITSSAASAAAGLSASSKTGPGVPGGRPNPASDGGATTADLSSPLDDHDGRDATVIGSRRDSEPADRYCGNCRHFEYVRGGSGITPFCGFNGERMDDMDACEEWTSRR